VAGASRSWIPTLLGVAAASLSVLSVIVVYRGASDEPYTVFRSSDALVQVILGSLLLFAWCEVALVVLWCAHRRLVSRRWIALIAWASVVSFYLWDSPSGYLSAIRTYAVSENRRGP
jgi:hypothetical protein